MWSNRINFNKSASILVFSGSFRSIHSTKRSKMNDSVAFSRSCLRISLKFFMSMVWMASIGIFRKLWQMKSNALCHRSVNSYLSAFISIFTQFSFVKLALQNSLHFSTSTVSSMFNAAPTTSSTFSCVISIAPVYIKSKTVFNDGPSMSSRTISRLDSSFMFGRELKYSLDAIKMLRWAGYLWKATKNCV